MQVIHRVGMRCSHKLTLFTRLVCKACVNDRVVTERFMRNVTRWTRKICHSHQILDLFFSLVALYTYGHPIVSTCRKQYICEAMQMQKGNRKGQEVNICLLLLEQSWRTSQWTNLVDPERKCQLYKLFLLITNTNCKQNLQLHKMSSDCMLAKANLMWIIFQVCFGWLPELWLAVCGCLLRSD